MKKMPIIPRLLAMTSVSLLLLVAAGPTDCASAVIITYFASGHSEEIYSFKGEGVLDSVELLVPADGVVLSASFDITGEGSGVDFPLSVKTYVGNMDHQVYQFMGNSYGKMGLQDAFLGDVKSREITFDGAGNDTSLKVRLPRSAKIKEASVRLGGTLLDAGWANAIMLSEKVGNNFLPINIGNRASPRLVDYDGDGDLDLLSGGNYYTGDGRWQTLWYYTNTGTKTKMNWTLDMTDFDSLKYVGTYTAFPRLIDLDRDSDYDLVVGEYYGRIRLFWNTGSASNPIWKDNGTGENSVFAGIGRGYYYVSPDLADMDNDGDDDLAVGHWMSGESNVGVESYKNNYLNGVYSWATHNFFSGIATDSYAYPAIVDFDKDGDYDIFIGYYNGTIGYYENTGTKEKPKWTHRPKVQGNMDVGTYASPTVGDLDNDGDLDLVIGALDGNFYYYENLRSYPTNPKLDIGNDGDVDWAYTGALKTRVVARNLTAELQTHLGGQDQPDFEDSWGNLFDDVVFNVSSESAGKLTLDDIDIRYEYTARTNDFSKALNDWIDDHRNETDENGNIRVPIMVYSAHKGDVKLSNLKLEIDGPPVWIEIPSTYAIDEDSRNNELIDLWQYIIDDYTEDSKLVLKVEQLDQRDIVDVDLNNGRYLSVDALTGEVNDNWNGKIRIKVSATDGRMQTAESNVFTVEVQPVNDPPELMEAPLELELLEDTDYTYQIQAIDVDGDILTFDIRNMPSGMELSSDGEIRWRPTNDDVGTHLMTIVVTDPHGLSDSVNCTVEVINVNDPPELNLPVEMTIIEGAPTYLDLTKYVKDVDNNIDELKADAQGKFINFNPNTWVVTILFPKESGIKESTLQVMVSDPSVTVEAEVLLTIVRVEKLAMIGIPDQEAVEEDTWTLDIKPYLYNVEDFNRLEITTSSRYIAVSGTKLTFYYPRDSLPDLLESVNVTAHQYDEKATDTFVVKLFKLGYDLQLTRIPDQYVLEVETTNLDIEPYIKNFVDINAVDVSVEGSAYVIVSDRVLTFSYPLYYAKRQETIEVTIAENEFADRGTFMVHIANGEDDFYLAEIPDMVVTETVPKTFNIKVYIMNADNMDYISASTDSPYVNVNRFDIQLIYPEGFTEGTKVMDDIVRVRICDGIHQFVRAVTIHVHMRDKQLLLSGIGDRTVYEDTDLVIDVKQYLYNVDNIQHVTMKISSQYASIEALVVTFNYPAAAGITQESVTFTAYEGEDLTAETITVYIEKVPLGFAFGPIGSLTVNEDEEFVFDVDPYLKNMDPVATYKLGVLSEYARVIGFTITFHYDEGPMNEIVRINVTGTNGDFEEQDVFIHVKGVNDRPKLVVDFDSDMNVKEGEGPMVINLTEHFKDEDTAKLHFKVSEKAKDLFVIDDENGTATIEFKKGAPKPDDLTGVMFFAYDPEDTASETRSNAFNVSFLLEGHKLPDTKPTGPTYQTSDGGIKALIFMALALPIAGIGGYLHRKKRLRTR